MTISELIGQLQNALSQYGDLEVLVDYVDIYEIEEFRNRTTEEMYVNIKSEECL